MVTFLFQAINVYRISDRLNGWSHDYKGRKIFTENWQHRNNSANYFQESYYHKHHHKQKFSSPCGLHKAVNQTVKVSRSRVNIQILYFLSATVKVNDQTKHFCHTSTHLIDEVYLDIVICMVAVRKHSHRYGFPLCRHLVECSEITYLKFH
jgi:hypothetical protein